MVNKTYDQYCGIAAALDVVGDRWTLLVLRELSFGQQRFTDLRSGLPGIASNLLSERLRTLEDAGLIEQRELPAPAARMVYALTESGQRINPVLRSLAAFGLPFLTDPVDGRVRPRMAVFGSLGAVLSASGPADLALRMRFELEGETLWLELQDGRVVRPDRSAEPDLIITGTAAALIDLCRGADLESLAPRLVVVGEQTAVAKFRGALPALVTAP
ncbi:MAG TPA: helix-turn-helix domain-containing protein [Marmoricola sp.]|nr:helix-turn-helix domain-containing protein [Marmoricola sp.]